MHKNGWYIPSEYSNFAENDIAKQTRLVADLHVALWEKIELWRNPSNKSVEKGRIGKSDWKPESSSILAQWVRWIERLDDQLKTFRDYKSLNERTPTQDERRQKGRIETSEGMEAAAHKAADGAAEVYWMFAHHAGTFIAKCLPNCSSADQAHEIEVALAKLVQQSYDVKKIINDKFDFDRRKQAKLPELSGIYKARVLFASLTTSAQVLQEKLLVKRVSPLDNITLLSENQPDWASAQAQLETSFQLEDLEDEYIRIASQQRVVRDSASLA